MGREFFVPAQTLIGVKLLKRHETDRPSTQLIEVTSCVERSNTTIKAKKRS
jgi:hypothetical protein